MHHQLIGHVIVGTNGKVDFRHSILTILDLKVTIISITIINIVRASSGGASALPVPMLGTALPL
jgi:hypothetical protein